MKKFSGILYPIIRTNVNEYVSLEKAISMNTKLTLSIDEEKVKKIKRISKKRGRSVSKIFEDYIDKVDKEDLREYLDINKIVGAFGKAPKNFDWKKEKADDLIKKYVR